MTKPLVRNAASRKQTSDALELEREQEVQRHKDLKAVLATQEGRRYMWFLMSRFSAFQSIYVPSSEIYFRAGLQEVGHFLLAECGISDQEALFSMQREAKLLADRGIEKPYQQDEEEETE